MSLVRDPSSKSALLAGAVALLAACGGPGGSRGGSDVKAAESASIAQAEGAGGTSGLSPRDEASAVGIR
jgi:hypothetical protein